MQPPPLPNNPYAAPQAQVADVWAHQHPETLQYAGFWLRFVAVIIDGFISGAMLMVIVVIVGVVFGLVMAGKDLTNRDFELFGNFLGFGLGLVIPWLYYAFCESSSWQATPGKKALGLRVTDMSGLPIGFGRASGRYWGKLVSYVILYVGFFMAGWTTKKQALHDMMAGTLVVRS
jgi:uncharacterized RDD family membrane protein YckC